MVAIVVPLLPRTAFDFVGLPPGSSVATTMVHRMPLFAWTSGSLLVRVESNTMFALIHELNVQVVESAPTCDDTTSDFVGDVLVQETIAGGAAVGVVRLQGLATPMPPYADLVIEQLNIGAATRPGEAIISVEMIVGGRFFDRIDRSQDRDTRSLDREHADH